MLSSLRLPCLSEELADDVGLWSALDVEFEALREVGEPDADATGLRAAVGEPKVPSGLGVSSGVIEATQLAP